MKNIFQKKYHQCTELSNISSRACGVLVENIFTGFLSANDDHFFSLYLNQHANNQSDGPEKLQSTVDITYNQINLITQVCQIAFKSDPVFASKIDPPVRAISALYFGFV